MNKPIVYVDFNELTEPGLVLLSKGDTKADLFGNQIHIYEGLAIFIYMDDPDIDGKEEYLVAEGIAELNTAKDWSSHVKWCCRIDENGIRSEPVLPSV